MSSLCGLTFQLKEPTPNKPEKVINIMVDAEGERYINYLQNQLQQKENIIKEVRGILKEGLEQFDTRRREEIYAEQYFENALGILDKVEE